MELQALACMKVSGLSYQTLEASTWLKTLVPLLKNININMKKFSKGPINV